MKSENHILLIHKKLSAQLTHSEIPSLQKYDAVNSTMEKELTFIWEKSANYQVSFSDRFNADKALIRFKSRIAEEEPQRKFPQRKTIWTAWSVGIAAAICVGFFAYLFLYQTTNTKLIAQTLQNEQKTLVLSDESVITLNTNTVLEYPQKFDDNERLVKLQGEAFFEIAPNTAKPFKIDLGDNISILVTGTAFNVNNFLGEFTEVFVSSGTVVVKMMDGSTHELKKGDKAIFGHKSPTLKKKTILHLNDLSWKTKSLSFEATPLKEITHYLAKHYNVQFNIDDKKIKNCSFTFTNLDNLSLEDAIRSIDKAFQSVRIEKTGNRAYKFKRVKGTSCE